MHSPEQGLIGHPQPMLTDIEFDDDGSMVLGFADRAGLQMGSYNYGPNTNDATLWYDTAQGEVLRAHNNGGSYVMESGGTTLAGGGNACPAHLNLRVGWAVASITAVMAGLGITTPSSCLAGWRACAALPM